MLFRSNFKEVIEVRKLPVDRIVREVLNNPRLLDGKRQSEDGLVKYCSIRVGFTIGKKTIRQVIKRMAETNILKSSITLSGNHQRMYHINEILCPTLNTDVDSRSQLITTILTRINFAPPI